MEARQEEIHEVPTVQVQPPIEQGFLMFIAENSGLKPDDLEKLFYNGFDNPESFGMISETELRSLGCSEDPFDALDKIQATMEVYREFTAANGAYQSAKAQQQMATEVDHQAQGGAVPREDTYPEPRVPSSAKPITRLMLLGPKAQKPPIHHAPFLLQLSHLKMTRRNISTLQVPDPKDASIPILFGQCPNLKILYLENNFLHDLSNSLTGLQHLIQINLHNNQIGEMDCFDECTQLRKLYLEHNRIHRLSGLHNCQVLEELYLGDQRIGNREFTFDEYSLAAISNTLVTLDMPSVNLVNCKPLYFLENLVSLNLNDNNISDFHEEVAPMLMTLIRLTTLSMLRNPVIRLTNKYRDQVVSLTQPQFVELDGRTIKLQERQYLTQLNARKQIKLNRQATNVTQKPLEQNSLMANQQHPHGGLQRRPTIPAKHTAAPQSMAIDGHAKKVYKSGNQKFTSVSKQLSDLPMNYKLDQGRAGGVNQLQMQSPPTEFDTYYGGGGGNDENDIQ